MYCVDTNNRDWELHLLYYIVLYVMMKLVLILIYIKENVCILYKEKYQNYRVMNYYKDVTILLNGLEYHQHKVFGQILYFLINCLNRIQLIPTLNCIYL